MTAISCVIRPVNGIAQYVPVAETFNISDSERIFAGHFRSEIAHDGPYGSHARTICLPLTQPEELPRARDQRF